MIRLDRGSENTLGNGKIRLVSPKGGIFLLDLFPGASLAYSVRQLNSSYSGPCIRIRRSSDNVEQDFGFSGGLVDDTAISSFLGVFQGLISAWYDQSGNGMHILIPTLSAQPVYTSSGINGKPVVDVTQTPQTFGFASLYSVGNSYDLFAYNTVRDLGVFAGRMMFAVASPDNRGLQIDGVNLINHRPSATGGGVLNTVTNVINVNRLYNVNRQGTTNVNYRYDSISQGNATLDANTNFEFRFINAWTSTQTWLGEHQEVLVYSTSLSPADRLGVETNILSYF